MSRRVKSKRKKRPVPPKSVIKLFRQTVPGSLFKAISPTDQYALLLLGHISHEISWFQRMLFIGQQTKTRSEVEREGHVVQILLLVRLMLGKLNEFEIILKKDEISDFVKANYEPADLEKGVQIVLKIRTHFAENPWIRTGRNKHFLHYPTFNDVKESLSILDDHWNFRIYHAERTAHTLYHSADAFANYVWFSLADSENPFKGFEQALDSLLNIAADIQALIEASIGNYIEKNLSSPGDTEMISLRVNPVSEQRYDFFWSSPTSATHS